MTYREDITAYNKAYYKANREKIRSRQRVYYEANKEKIRVSQENYKEVNREQILVRQKTWRGENPERQKASYAAWRKNNLDHLKTYRKERLQRDAQFKLACSLRIRLCMATKRNFKSGSAVRDLGCSIEYLKAYLEGQFEPGMSWDNWGKAGWEIDHIRPLASFDLTDPEQFKQAVHYTNLQPLWAKDNRKKGARV